MRPAWWGGHLMLSAFLHQPVPSLPGYIQQAAVGVLNEVKPRCVGVDSSLCIQGGPYEIVEERRSVSTRVASPLKGDEKSESTAAHKERRYTCALECQIALSGERSRSVGARVGNPPVLPTGQVATARARDHSLMMPEYYSTMAEPRSAA